MNNPFVVSSAALGMKQRLISLVDMHLLEEDEANGVIIRLTEGDFEQLFVLNRQILDIVVPEEKETLYVLTHDAVYHYPNLTPGASPVRVPHSDDLGVLKKLYASADTLFLIAASDRIFMLNAAEGDIVDISSELGESEGLERLLIRNGVLKYAVGWNGLILSYESGEWHEVASPTNRILSAIDETKDGTLIVVGQSGILLRGRVDELEVIPHDWEGYDFWDVTVYGEREFLLSEIGVFELLDGKEVVPVLGRMQKKSIFFTFKRCGEKLWAVGERNILEFNGAEWKEVFSLSSD